MAFVTNSLNFPNLTSKASPVSGDLLMLADSAASNAIKQCTVGSLPFSASSGALVLLATVSASNVATVDFANNLSSTYDNYLVTIENHLPVTNATVAQTRVGTGSTPTWQATNYSCNNLLLSSPLTAGGSSSTEISLSGGTNQSNTATRTAAWHIFVHNVNDSSNDKNMEFVGEYFGGSASLPIAGGGRWHSGTVVTSLRYLQSSGSILTGTFKLYGIVNS